MSDKPEALLLADALEADPCEEDCMQAAALLDRQHAEIESLRAERDALRADAERWEYVRKNPWRAIDILNDKCSLRPAYWREEADAAIDAAREAK